MTDHELVLQFVREPKFGSDMIAWFSHGQFSHVEAIWPDNPELTYGSYERQVGRIRSGVQFRPVGYHELSLCVHCHIPMTELQLSLWKSWQLEQEYKPYDWDAIWGFVAGRNWRDPGQWICSEIQARALEICGKIPHLYLPSNRITPVALALVCSALDGVWFERISPSGSDASLSRRHIVKS